VQKSRRFISNWRLFFARVVSTFKTEKFLGFENGIFRKNIFGSAGN